MLVKVICSLSEKAAHVLEVNQRVRDRLGSIVRMNFCRNPIARIIHDADSQTFLEKLAECCSQKQALSFECRLITEFGSAQRYTLVCRSGPKRKNVPFVSYSISLSAKRAEEALRQSEERMRLRALK